MKFSSYKLEVDEKSWKFNHDCSVCGEILTSMKVTENESDYLGDCFIQERIYFVCC